MTHCVGPCPGSGRRWRLVPKALRGGRLHRAVVTVASAVGWVNPIEAFCGIDDVLADDTYVVSYPRSGNTWTRYILAYLVRGTESMLDPEAVNAIVPDAYVHSAIVNAQSQRRLIKIHEPFMEACPRVICVHRDYRETLVSYWHFIRRSERYAGSFSAFLRSGIPGRHGGWKGHIRAMWRRQKADPTTIHVIRYADLVGNFPEAVAGLVAWSGIGRGADLAAVQRLTAMETVAGGEKAYVGHFRRISGESFFVDRGKGADWMACWSPEDLAWLARDRELMAIMEQLGYR
jgi:hypothetical protein